MNRNNVWIAAMAALGTMTGVLTLTLARGVEAGADDKGPGPEIAVPTLNLNGCQLTLAPERKELKEGDKPVLILKAFNPGPARHDLAATVSMSDTRPNEAMSRMVREPRTVFTREVMVSVEPGQSTSITIETGLAVEAEHIIRFTLGAKGQPAIGIEGGRVAAGDQNAPVIPIAPSPITSDNRETRH